MAFISCPKCAAQVPSRANFCPTCGVATQRSRGLNGAIGCVILIVGAMWVVSLPARWLTSAIESHREAKEREQAEADAQRLTEQKEQQRAARTATFMAAIADHYSVLTTAISVQDYAAARQELTAFAKAGAMGYRDVAAREKHVAEAEILASIAAVGPGDLPARIALTRQLIALVPTNDDYRATLVHLEADLAEQQRQAAATAAAAAVAAAAAEQERQRIAHRHDLGMWRVLSHGDASGSPTATKYITNVGQIFGTFSNASTTEVPFGVDLRIDGADQIAFTFYRYATKNPLPTANRETYLVDVQDREGTTHHLSATSQSDRLILATADAARLSQMFLQGGKVRFHVSAAQRVTESYRFEITNPAWYENALRMIGE